MRKIELAQSLKNGIIFHSTELPGFGVYAYYDEKENLKIERWTISNAEQEKDTSKFKAVIFSIILTLLSIITLNVSIIFGAIWFSIMGARDLFIILPTIKDNMLAKKGMRTSKFHAAEHMVINAYNRLGRVPTIEEIKNSSYISENCGSIKYFRRLICAFIVAFISTLGGIMNMFNLWSIMLFNVLYWAVIGVAFIIIILDMKKNVFKYLQIFILAKPSESELIAAQQGIEEFEVLESYLEERKKMFNSKLQN